MVARRPVGRNGRPGVGAAMRISRVLAARSTIISARLHGYHAGEQLVEEVDGLVVSCCDGCHIMETQWSLNRDLPSSWWLFDEVEWPGGLDRHGVRAS